MNIIDGHLATPKGEIALVVSRFNSSITENLLKGAITTLKNHGVKEEQLTIAHVPGAFELPLAAQQLALSKKYVAILCLGAVIRGDTPHFDYVCAETSSGIMSVGLKNQLPVIFGVLTTDTEEQAIARSLEKGENKGSECALAALEMICLLERLKAPKLA